MRASRLLSANDEIEEYKKIYAVAIAESKTDRAELKTDLQKLLHDDLAKFEQKVEEIIGTSRPDKVVIKSDKISLGYFWEPGRLFGGSRLRAALIKSHNVVVQQKIHFFNLKLEEILNRLGVVIKKLNDKNELKQSADLWKELKALQKDVTDLSDLNIENIADVEDKLNQLKDFILYKQAELFFNKFVAGGSLVNRKGAELKDAAHANKIEAEHGMNEALHILIQDDPSLMDSLDAILRIKEMNKDLLEKSENLFLYAREVTEEEEPELQEKPKLQRGEDTKDEDMQPKYHHQQSQIMMEVLEKMAKEKKAPSLWKQLESLYEGKKPDFEQIKIIIFLRDLYLSYQEKMVLESEDPEHTMHDLYLEYKGNNISKEEFSRTISESLDTYKIGLALATIQEMQDYHLSSSVKEFCVGDPRVVQPTTRLGC